MTLRRGAPLSSGAARPPGALQRRALSEVTDTFHSAFLCPRRKPKGEFPSPVRSIMVQLHCEKRRNAFRGVCSRDYNNSMRILGTLRGASLPGSKHSFKPAPAFYIIDLRRQCSVFNRESSFRDKQTQQAACRHSRPSLSF